MFARCLDVDAVAVLVVEDLGTEARVATSRRLEALEPVANRPIAHHVLDVLESTGVQEVVVASSTEFAGDVRACLSARARDGKSGPELRYVAQPAPLDLPGALSLAAPLVGPRPCIVHLAGGLLGEPLARFLGPMRGNSPDVAVIVHQGRAPGGRLSAPTQDMLHIAELYPERSALRMAGVWLCGPGAVGQIAGAAWGGTGDVDLTKVGQRVAAAGGSFDVRRADAWRRYAGDPLDLLELNRIALDRLETDLHPGDHDGNRIEGRVQIDERASVRGSVIVGPAVIGPGARVADAYIGPYTSIGARARVEGAEIERSIVSADASIMHVGGRLAASVVGRGARIFQDFSLPRVLRVRVGDGTEVALC